VADFTDPVPPVFAKATNASIVLVKVVHRKARRPNVPIARPMMLAVLMWRVSII
jgi:hypothetical protein